MPFAAVVCFCIVAPIVVSSEDVGVRRTQKSIALAVSETGQVDKQSDALSVRRVKKSNAISEASEVNVQSDTLSVRRVRKSIALSDVSEANEQSDVLVRRVPKQHRNAHAASYSEEGESLRRVLEPFVKGPGFTPAELDKAFAALDMFGQPLPLPLRKEVDALDSNVDGIITFTELRAWGGLKDRWCRNQGEIMYGCRKRCVHSQGARPQNDLDGKAEFFSEHGIYPYPFHPSMVELSRKGADGTGAISPAQYLALRAGLAEVVKHGVEGTICEFGVFQGGTSIMLHDFLQQLNGTQTHPLHLFDSFEGLPPCDRERDVGMCEKGAMKSRVDFIKNKFQSSSRLMPGIHKGFFNKISDSEIPDKIAFAFLDGDLYESIYSALERVYPRLSPGGIVMVHDFGWEGYPGTLAATDDYLKDKKEKMQLPGVDSGVACYIGMMKKA